MPFDYGFRLNNRQRIANGKPIEANKSQSVDGAEGQNASVFAQGCADLSFGSANPVS
jgi:hypothetical protein